MSMITSFNMCFRHDRAKPCDQCVTENWNEGVRVMQRKYTQRLVGLLMLIIVFLGLCYVGLLKSHVARDACEARGGVYLWRDKLCIRTLEPVSDEEQIYNRLHPLKFVDATI